MILPRAWQARRSCAVAVAAMGCMLAALGGAQAASAQAPHWKLSSSSAPTNLPLQGEQLVGENDAGIKGEGMILATTTNLGDANSKGKITLTDLLPEGLEPTKVRAVAGRGIPGAEGQEFECRAGEGLTFEHGLSCAINVATREVDLTFEGEVPPYEHLQLEASVKIKTATVPLEPPINTVTVTGGEAPEQELKQPLKIAGAGGLTPFGVEAYEFTPENEQGKPETQAGAHPFQLTTTFDLNQTYGKSPGFEVAAPQAPAQQRDLTFKIPAGVLGSATAVPQCTDVAFGALRENGINACPDGTAIGAAVVTFNEPNLYGLQAWSVPVFNLVPAPGEPAKFGIDFDHVPISLDTSLRTGEDYGVTVSVHETSEAVHVLGAQVTLWGIPGSPSHDQSRGWNCIGNGRFVEKFNPRPECVMDEFPQPKPFLILPTSCGTPLVTEVTGDAWSGATLQARNEPPWAPSQPVSTTGCEKLEFNPSISLQPDVSSSSTPSGMTVAVNMPQKETTLESGQVVTEGDIEDTTVALPEGVQASAGAANGLGTCGLGESGLLGEPFPQEGEQHFPEQFEQRFTPVVATCPDAAKIGTVEIETALLPHTLTGGVYLGDQNVDPFKPPLVLYVIATEEEPIHHEWSKVLVKLAGEVKINPTTGQLTSTFKHTPQAPFEHLRLHLFGGPRASQATPAHCGQYNAAATFTAWNGDARTAGEEPGEGFQITSLPGGGPCPAAGALPFAPGFVAGATNTQAGAFTEFSLTIGHPDGQQALTGLSTSLPQGAAAMLASVTPCPIARADAGQCGPESRIGHSIASSGLGESPVTLEGEVFLTEGFDGAPFGVSDVTPATHVGPFNIGEIIANSTIEVNENTAVATITVVETRILEFNSKFAFTGNTQIASSPLPTIIKGVPVQLKQITVTVDRPNFEFNPTDCSGLSVTGAPIAVTDTLSGAEGGSASQSTPYGVTGCGALGFSPTLTASVGGKGSKADGTSFAVKVTASPGKANIGKTFLTIPASLPARLTTIQKACPDSTFEANPATCDEGSNIGYAVAHTPVLRSPLQGPAYLVSHGNAGFPDVEFVLQGEGITLVLDGKTDIKKGVTYSRFESVPDAPVTTFETVLPAGPHSALTANVPEDENFSLCKTKVDMPTEITGQNGALIKDTTNVTVTGCGGVLGAKYTSAQLLARALKACRKDKSKSKRAACEKRARKAYRARQLAQAVKVCKKDTSKSKRAACEKRARKKYAAAKR